jgi:phosphoglucomutase/phosphomannomutase
MTDERLEGIKSKLLAAYPATGEVAWRNISQWLSGSVPLVPDMATKEFVDHAPLDLLHESFWRSIPFGTGGVRGTVGFGPNRINPTVVALTIQAHCKFLEEFLDSDRGRGYERAVVIANDVRKFLDATGTLKFLGDNPYDCEHDPAVGVSSRSLAFLAAEVYAANGFVVYMIRPGDDSDEALLTTPELSYLIRRLRASGGINLSASHNPPDDNGVKVYDENGGQYLPPFDQMLTDMTGTISEVSRIPYAQAVGEGLVREVPSEALDDYMHLYLDRATERGLASERGTSIVFTPLSGCGGRTVGAALRALGYVVHTPADEGPDGTFEKIPLHAPNPEVPESTARSKMEADRLGATLVLASDPDADRLGAEVRHGDGWYHLTGNQIATILAYYLLLDPDGPRLRGGVYQTIVTTLAVEQIAQKAGCQPVVSDLLVGFKYIGEAVLKYGRDRDLDPVDPSLLAFAAEESHGYLDTPQLRDKDAMGGALYLARLHERLGATGRTLVDYLNAIYADVGQYGDRGRSIVIVGSAGVRRIRAVMDELRAKPPTVLAGLDVTTDDYWDEQRRGPIRSATEREARNVLVFSFDGGRITLRPSGTEPKLKFYVQTASGNGDTGAQAWADEISEALYGEVLRMLGHELAPEFASLPDVISLNAKLEMQDEVVPHLRGIITTEDAGFVAAWLRERVKPLVPGESASQIAAEVLRSTSRLWPTEEANRLDAVLTIFAER